MTAASPVELDAASEDRLILGLWAAGQRNEGMRRLLEVHGGRVRAALRKRYPSVRDEHALLEAIHDAARNVFQAYDAAKGCSLGGWFLFIAGRRLCDLLRAERLRRTKTVPLEGGHCRDDRSSPSDHLLRLEFHAAVDQALSQLSELERAVIEADIDAGKQARADRLARRLNTSEHSIYAARARARRKLLRSPQLKSHYRSTG
ncbi:MAG TPA: sigma-70 family RNA polymerase sigma factor [Pirellulales bacterium]|nr:sigma-70 family RNA polymerase sigma factor [Pirellulales bacterium]